MAIKNRKIVYPLLFLLWFLTAHTDKSIMLIIQPFCEYGLDTKIPVFVITLGIFVVLTIGAAIKEVHYAKFKHTASKFAVVSALALLLMIFCGFFNWSYVKFNGGILFNYSNKDKLTEFLQIIFMEQGLAALYSLCRLPLELIICFTMKKYFIFAE